jgi:hypothetical protein
MGRYDNRGRSAPFLLLHVKFRHMKKNSKTMPLQIITLLLGLMFAPMLFAGGVYQEPAAFIKQVFDNKPPKAEVLWLNKALKKQIETILDHSYRGFRVRYWQQRDTDNNKSVWILDEIGKEKLITAGIVISNQRIQQVKVLVFRESRGWEVRHDFFTDQFKQVKLKNDQQLDKTIDNISGATLSVRAVRKMAQIALLLDQEINLTKTNHSAP